MIGVTAAVQGLCILHNPIEPYRRPISPQRGQPPTLISEGAWMLTGPAGGAAAGAELPVGRACLRAVAAAALVRRAGA